MPTPQGDITSTETWTENQAAYDAAMAEAIEKIKKEDSELLERLEDEDDLPELS